MSILIQIHRIVEHTENLVGQALSRQISDLSKKRDQFDQHFVQILQDHLKWGTTDISVTFTCVIGGGAGVVYKTHGLVPGPMGGGVLRPAWGRRKVRRI